MSWKNVQYENGKYRTSEGGGGGSSTFAGLDDVNFTNIQNGQVPKYNSTTQKWENANESGGSGHTYSTTEQVIGTWIDGKPLYEKTVSFGALPNSTTKSVAHGISNVTGESFKKIDTIMAVSGANGFAIPYRITDDGGDVKRQVFFEVNATNVIAYSRNYNNSVFDTCFITLQYTKTTDV